jgi:uncharacterized integral membrane protein
MGTDTALGVDVRRADSRGLGMNEVLAVGTGSGLLGGIALAAPIVIWDWVRAGHRAFELPMAATAWLFGLQHFSHERYLAWPLVIGIALLAVFVALTGVAFTALADRVYGARRPLSSLAAGFAWGFVTFIFFWDMLLPIARGGAPFRAAPGAAGFVAPTWVWILGFTLLGLLTAASYALLRTSRAREDATVEGRAIPPPLHPAA